MKIQFWEGPFLTGTTVTLVAFVPGLNVAHQILSGGGREASDEVTVFPGHRDRKPKLPQGFGVRNPAEGDPFIQLQERVTPSGTGVDRHSPD